MDHRWTRFFVPHRPVTFIHSRSYLAAGLSLAAGDPGGTIARSVGIVHTSRRNRLVQGDRPGGTPERARIDHPRGRWRRVCRVHPRRPAAGLRVRRHRARPAPVRRRLAGRGRRVARASNSTSATAATRRPSGRSSTRVGSVVHLGEIVGDPACELDPTVTVAVNYTATIRLAELAQQAGVERFIYPSSCSVYGATDVIVDELGAAQPGLALRPGQVGLGGAHPRPPDGHVPPDGLPIWPPCTACRRARASTSWSTCWRAGPPPTAASSSRAAGSGARSSMSPMPPRSWRRP